eukprot:6411945-Pyramimonas_sp.AAC.1
MFVARRQGVAACGGPPPAAAVHQVAGRSPRALQRVPHGAPGRRLRAGEGADVHAVRAVSHARGHRAAS